ncbi:MAG: acyl carrier protein [Clostridium sp.]|jgi:acyl carrier protein|nr:acyl carrier protein [Clostridium sp.]
MEETKVRIREFLAKFYRKGEIEEEQNIYELGFTNSLFAMQLVMFLEKEFQIRIGNEDISRENFQTIRRIGDLIRKKTGETQPSP